MSEDKDLETIRKKKEDLLKKIAAMPAEVVQITSVDQFNKLMEDYKNVPIVIDFWADWCAPCKVFAPIFHDVQKQWGTEFVFAQLNTEHLPAVANTLNVVGIPMMLFILNKKEIHRHSGALRRGQFLKLLKAVKDAINKNTPADRSGMYS